MWKDTICCCICGAEANAECSWPWKASARRESRATERGRGCVALGKDCSRSSRAEGSFGTRCPKQQDTLILNQQRGCGGHPAVAMDRCSLATRRAREVQRRPWDTGVLRTPGLRRSRAQPVPALSDLPSAAAAARGKSSGYVGNTSPVCFQAGLNLAPLPRSYKSCSAHIFGTFILSQQKDPSLQRSFLLVQIGYVYITCGIILPLLIRLKATACMCQACQIITCCILSV